MSVHDRPVRVVAARLRFVIITILYNFGTRFTEDYRVAETTGSNERFIMDLQPWAPYLSIIEIILGAALVVLVMVQAKGSDLGSLFGGGGEGGGFRTKRGIEATLHRLTIVTSVLFFINTLLAFLAWGQVV